MFDVEVEAVDGEGDAVVVEGAGLGGGDPGCGARAKEAPEEVGEAGAVGAAGELVLRGFAAEGEEEFFVGGGLPAGVEVALDVGALVQRVGGRVGGAVVAGARVHGRAALVAEVEAREAVGLGREEVHEREDDDVDVRVGAVCA